jgi:hypothetical protein
VTARRAGPGRIGSAMAGYYGRKPARRQPPAAKVVEMAPNSPVTRVFPGRGALPFRTSVPGRFRAGSTGGHADNSPAENQQGTKFAEKALTPDNRYGIQGFWSDAEHCRCCSMLAMSEPKGRWSDVIRRMESLRWASTPVKLGITSHLAYQKGIRGKEVTSSRTVCAASPTILQKRRDSPEDPWRLVPEAAAPGEG